MPLIVDEAMFSGVNSFLFRDQYTQPSQHLLSYRSFLKVISVMGVNDFFLTSPVI